MLLNSKTLGYLKIFSTINQNIIIRSGNVLKVMSPSKTVIAKVVLDQEFPKEFAILELSRFVNILSLLDEPTLEFFEEKVLISSKNKNSVEYAYCDPSFIKAPPEKDLELPTKDVEFTLSQDSLNAVMKAANILSLENIAFLGKGGKITVECFTNSNPTSDKFSQQIGDTEKNFKVVFDVENLKLLPRSYEVAISAIGFSKFKSVDVEYLIAIKSETSNFGEEP